MVNAVQLLTLQDVAEVLKVSESTVRRWIRIGHLPAFKIGARGQLRVRQDELEQFLEQQRFLPHQVQDERENPHE